MVNITSLFFISLILFVFQANCSSSFLKNKVYLKSLEAELEIIKSNAFEAFCFLNMNGTVYDLNSLHISDHDYNTTDGKYTLNYNFCGEAKHQCKDKNTTSLAVMTSNTDKNSCFALGGSKTTLSKWNFLSYKRFKK